MEITEAMLDAAEEVYRRQLNEWGNHEPCNLRDALREILCAAVGSVAPDDD